MKKRLILVSLLCLILTLTAAASVFASDTFDALYTGTVRVSNNSTATTAVSVTITGTNTTSFIDGGFMYQSGNNTAIQQATGVDTIYMPGYQSNPWVLFVQSIEANTLQNNTLYMGGETDMDAAIRYFPGDGGMIVTDDSDIEPGDNFTWQASGYFDATATGDLVSKGDEFSVYGDGSGSVYAHMEEIVDEYTTNDDSYTEFYGVAWRGQTFTTSSAYTISAVLVKIYREGSPDTFDVGIRETSGGLPTGADLTSGSINASAITDNTSGEWYSVNLTPQALNNATMYAIVCRATSGDADNSVTWRMDGSSPTYGGGTYVWSGNSGSVWTADDTRDFMFQTASMYITIEASGLSSGEKDFAIWADGSDLHIAVDGSESDNASIGSGSIADNTDNWTMLTNGVMPYADNITVEIDGTLAGSWDWEYDTTFQDDSAYDNDATPTFRTTSSDPDVSAELLTFGPISEAQAPAYSVDISTTCWITSNVTQSGNFTTTTNATYPGSDVVSAVATAGNTPIQLLELIMAGVIVLSLSLFISWIMRKNREGSIFVKVIVIAAGLGILVAISVVDNWMLYLFLMISIAIAMMASQHVFTGTGNTGNNMIGFLSMSFVGMTLINRILEGRVIQESDVSTIRNVLAFQPFEVFGVFTIPVPNTGFLTDGLPALMSWDYSVFGGNAQIFQYLLYSVTAVVSFILLVLVFGAVYQMFSRGR